MPHSVIRRIGRLGKCGAGAWLMVSPDRQENFGRTCLITRNDACRCLKISVTS